MEQLDEGNETLEQLILLIGRDNARKVFKCFEGESIYFPKSIGLAERRQQIYNDLQNGMSYTDAARKYHYTVASIREIEHKVLDERRAVRRGEAEPRPTLRDPAPAPTFRKGELFYDGE
jgi:Mor family transcriptional regulator